MTSESRAQFILVICALSGRRAQIGHSFKNELCPCNLLLSFSFFIKGHRAQKKRGVTEL